MVLHKAYALVAAAAILLCSVTPATADEYCDADPAESCVSNSDCRRRYSQFDVQFYRICRDEICVPKECGIVPDGIRTCPTDQTCSDGECKPLGNEFDECVSSSACAGDLECGPSEDGSDHQCLPPTTWEGWSCADRDYCPGTLKCDEESKLCKGFRLIYPGHSCPPTPDLDKYNVACNHDLGSCNVDNKCVSARAARCERQRCTESRECDTRMCAFGETGNGYCLENLRLIGEECIVHQQCVSAHCDSRHGVCGGKDCTMHSCPGKQICRMVGTEPSCMSMPTSCAPDEYWDFNDFFCKKKLPPGESCMFNEQCATFENCRYPGAICAPFAADEPAPEGFQCWGQKECETGLVCTPKSPGGDAFCTYPKQLNERCLVSGWQPSCAAGLDCRPDPADPSHKTGHCVRSTSYFMPCQEEWGTCVGNHEECLCLSSEASASCLDSRQEPLRSRELFDTTGSPSYRVRPDACRELSQRTGELCLRGRAAHRYGGFLASPLYWGPASMVAILQDASPECLASEAASACCQLCDSLEEHDDHATAYSALYDPALSVSNAPYYLFKYFDLTCGDRPSMRLRENQCSADPRIPSAFTTVAEFKTMMQCPTQAQDDARASESAAAAELKKLARVPLARAAELDAFRERLERMLGAAHVQTSMLLSDEEKQLVDIQLNRVRADGAALERKAAIQRQLDAARDLLRF